MFGTRSEQGERAVERLLTIMRTCELQQRNVLVYLTAAIAAHCRRQSGSITVATMPNPLNCYPKTHRHSQL